MSSKAEVPMRVMKSDRNNIRWVFLDGRVQGYGFRQKYGRTIFLMRCPKDNCQRENYAPAVASGVCAWCGFDANKK